MKQLGTRRTLNKRTLSDANLSDRRAKASEAKASRYQQAYTQSFTREISGDIERAAADTRESDLQAELEVAKAQLQEQTELAAKYKAVAEPPKEKFFAHGHYTADVDLTALELIANLSVSPNVVPKLFAIFSRFFGVTIPKTKARKVQTGIDANGKRTYAVRQLFYIPGITHMKQLPAIGGELHKLQVGEWLLQDPEGKYCYIADGANSQQREILAQLLSRRSKETGKLESMCISIDEIADKSSEGQQRKFRAALESIAEGWEEADALGLLPGADHGEPDAEPTAEQTAVPTAVPTTEPTDEPADAPSFFEQRRKLHRAKLRAKIAELQAAATMNDRAAPARKAARLSRGGDGSGGAGDVEDDPTCAHHAVANIGEEGRKAIDKGLKAKMNITAEQSESDSAKVKALRTNVGWFSSPVCSLIYQVTACHNAACDYATSIPCKSQNQIPHPRSHPTPSCLTSSHFCRSASTLPCSHQRATPSVRILGSGSPTS